MYGCLGVKVLRCERVKVCRSVGVYVRVCEGWAVGGQVGFRRRTLWVRSEP
jgi:hypothetical protein